jgi:Zn-dependent M16 (insulinase) family peptidase
LDTKLIFIQAIVSFLNQALKGVPQKFQVDLLERYQAVTKEDILAILQKYILPLFDSSSSVAVAVTAPSKVNEIHEGLSSVGFEVENQTLDFDPGELEDGLESGSETDGESDGR